MLTSCVDYVSLTGNDNDSVGIICQTKKDKLKEKQWTLNTLSTLTDYSYTAY